MFPRPFVGKNERIAAANTERPDRSTYRYAVYLGSEEYLHWRAQHQ